MVRSFVLALIMGVSAAATAAVSVTVPVVYMGSSRLLRNTKTLTAELQTQFASEDLRQIRVQNVEFAHSQPSALILRLFSAHFHRFDDAKVMLGKNLAIASVIRPFQITTHATNVQPVCPDPTVEFISFAPNDNDLEQGYAREVAQTATQRGLKTVLLLGQDATRVAYLNYMSCPNLKGNFYDGDSNPYEMVTADDAITSQDYSTVLKGAFRYRVTNIWLACEAFNDPMLSAVTKDAQAQKYAAGVNDLQVGPSDHAAACAMEAGINGQPLTAAFQNCYKQYDNSSDQWGFGGNGADYFGQAL